ncbi:peptidase M24 [Coraliomargarita sinensis]|uniref:Peptidase M24 n=1 Tax=Coraliomargarita sinensis TaxID=2174842 RepID=A0A317ZF16_9BACT|nr:M24 family metallopeptidase [Coraliomargarita sinensis]PXA03422.1 peptidase M24 [Coraliomargarita sinensis]
MKSKSSTIRFLYASSDDSADVLYLGGVFVPDPYLSILTAKKSYAVVNRLEYSRVKAKSNYDEVMLLEEIKPKAAELLGLAKADVGPGELMCYFAQRFAVKKVEVPADFPAIYYAVLHEAGYSLKVKRGPFFPKRQKKTDAEARAVRQGNAASAAGIRAAEAVLRESVIDGKRLVYKGRVLTSERLRTIIDQVCLEKGAVAKNTIVAGGRQACDPHEAGHGPLRPNELIIIDVFPRVQKTGYHGDMTRTFLKGRATPEQRKLVAAVRGAQAAALAAVQAGAKAHAVHAAAENHFAEAGYKTERSGNRFTGFIHSTGHGLGLQVHEPPSVSTKKEKLKADHVITIEPGLYYPKIGGCRIEDVVRVTEGGYERLSRMHYRWEIR